MKDTTAIEIKNVVEGITTFSIKPRVTGKKKKLIIKIRM